MKFIFCFDEFAVKGGGFFGILKIKLRSSFKHRLNADTEPNDDFTFHIDLLNNQILLYKRKDLDEGLTSLLVGKVTLQLPVAASLSDYKRCKSSICLLSHANGNLHRCFSHI